MQDDKETAIIEIKPENGLAKPIDAVVAKKENGLAVSEIPVGAGQIQLTEGQIKILYNKVNPDDIEIRYFDGLIYLPWMEYASRLREAFALGWAIVPRGKPIFGPGRTSIMQEFDLYIQGNFASRAWGEQAYIANNPKMNWTDACEGAKSNALMRLCKGIGIGLELWRPSFIRQWKEKYAETYQDDKGKTCWRRKDYAGREVPLDEISTILPEPKIEPKPKEEQFAFFTDEEVSQKPTGQLFDTIIKSIGPKEKPIYDETAREAIINAIKESLKAEGINESEFRAWLDIYGVACSPPRHFVGKMGHAIRFHMGDGDDLKFLYSKISDAIKKFRTYKKGL